MAFTCSKESKHKFVKYDKYVWKPMYKMWSKIKAQERYESDVFLVSLLSISEEWVLRNQLNICNGAFLQFNGQNLKFSTKYTYITLWLLDFDLAGLIEDFLPVSWAHFFKYLKNSFWKKKKLNNLMLKTHSTYSSDLGQHSILVRKGTFYEKRVLFFNKI